MVLQSSSKHEEIILPHECIFVFIWYFIWADLPKKYCQKCKDPKRDKKWMMAI